MKSQRCPLRALAYATSAATLGLILAGSTLRGATMTFSTAPGSNIAGEPVNATAQLTTTTDTVDITLINNQEDPISVKQVITGLFFELSTGQTSGMLSSISAQERTVLAGGTFTDDGPGNTGWVLTQQGSFALIDILNNSGQPQRGVIGPPNSGTNQYDNAGGSIAGNGPHNPFFNQSADFHLHMPGVTAASTVKSVVFQFNTVAGDNVPGVVPEPTSGMLYAVGLAILMMIPTTGRRRHAWRDGE